MIEQLKIEWQKRPIWMNLIFLFCLFMVFIYSPFDIFTKPYAQWADVWLGYTLTGWYAKAGEQLHWLVYSLGAYGFWKMKSWMWPWAAIYSAQVVVAMVVFSVAHSADLFTGIMQAAVTGGIFLIPTIALWRAKALFTEG